MRSCCGSIPIGGADAFVVLLKVISMEASRRHVSSGRLFREGGA